MMEDEVGKMIVGCMTKEVAEILAKHLTDFAKEVMITPKSFEVIFSKENQYSIIGNREMTKRNIMFFRGASNHWFYINNIQR